MWRNVDRAVDQHGQVIDVPVSPRRDAAAARQFVQRALTALKVTPREVVRRTGLSGGAEELAPSRGITSSGTPTTRGAGVV